MLQSEQYEYAGARTLVLLHERHLRKFLEAWNYAKAAEVRLPETTDPDYASLDALLRHVLACARSYMVWICEKLDLPDPEIEPAPDEEAIEMRSADYLEHLLQRWRRPLSQVPERAFFDRSYPSRWKTEYCVDAMLEHAILHPMRHTFQLRELAEKEGKETPP
ncbi:MAG: DUF664 domain-containing protein [Candidatus Eiseniibacteriota bacterium]|nr:MAG: DUF664 domain-containing protein [Candidatus Eisenbacteria bacterium]